jgi:hypothetical protein
MTSTTRLIEQVECINALNLNLLDLPQLEASASQNKFEDYDLAAHLQNFV